MRLTIATVARWTGSLKRMVRRLATGSQRAERLRELKRQRTLRMMDRLERELEHDMDTLPSGPDRRRANDDLLWLRVMRSMLR
jgi:hypothetical protein